jgi:chromosome partitioning protein
MATGEAASEQPEQPGTASGSDVDSAHGGSGWFSVDDPDPDRRAPGPTGSGPAPDDAAIDWRTSGPGPDLISAGMVHVDPEPGIDSPAPPAGASRPDVPAGEPHPERSWDWKAQDSPAGPEHLAALTGVPPEAAAPEAAHRSGEPAHDPDGSPRGPEHQSDPEDGLGVAARAGDGPAADVPAEGGREVERDAAREAGEAAPPAAGPGVGRDPSEAADPEVGAEAVPKASERADSELGPGAGAEAVRDPGHTAEPGAWTEPALPMRWPPALEAPGGGGIEGRAADDEQEQPPPDPRWPRLFAVGRDGPGPAQGHDAGASAEAGTGGQAVEASAHGITGAAKTEQLAGTPPTSASGAPSQAHANMAPAGVSDPPVSPETEGGGGVVKQRPDDPSIEEDEAAIAVREAVSRAVAQAGVDVSRETSTDAAVEPTTTPGAVVEALGDTPRIDSERAARNARVTFRIHTDGANGHGRILAVANQKGGVGKSTTAVNLGAYLALAGARILVVDLDPQGNASTGLGLDHRNIEPSIYDVLTGEIPTSTAIRATTVANLHVLPSTIDLAGAEVELVSAMSREGRLRRALESIHQHYDTVLVDCPPSLGLLTVNALAAADELLIPIQCEYYALEGLGQLLRNVELVRANLNPELRIGGIVLTMYDGRTRLAEQVVGEVRKHFSDLVYQTVVPRSVRLSEAPGYGLPIALYDPLSRGGIAYRDLAFELAERSGLLAPTGEGAS